MKGTIYATLKDGAVIEIMGESAALDSMIELLEASGFTYNEHIETWDEGFYDSTHKKSPA